jgi:Bacteriophage lambda head decoration protein D
MSDISVRAGSTYINEDQRWIGPATIGELRTSTDTITLDRSAFDLVTAFPNGIIPSGVVLGKITATGLYAPYADAGAGGLDTAVGFLVTSIVYDRNSAATSDIVAALLWKGEVIEAFLPTNHGLTAAARVDFAAKFRLL